jgi:hypothetical protein
MGHKKLLEFSTTLNSLELLTHQSLQMATLNNLIPTSFITIRKRHTSTRSCADWIHRLDSISNRLIDISENAPTSASLQPG